MFHLKMQPNISFTVLSVIFLLNASSFGRILKTDPQGRLLGLIPEGRNLSQVTQQRLLTQLKYSQIESDSSPKKSLSLDQLSQDLEMPTQKALSRLSIFESFFRVQLNICPCLLEIDFIDFENPEKRKGFLDYVEGKENPLQIEEITDDYLEMAMTQEIEAIRARYAQAKHDAMGEVKQRRELFLEEITIRALNSIWTEVLYIVRNGRNMSDQIGTSLDWIRNRVALLQRLKRTARLEEIATRKFDNGIDDYVSHFEMASNVKQQLKSALWEFFPAQKLNELSKERMAAQGDLLQGAKLIMTNGMCMQSEADHPGVRYLRYMDFLSIETSKDDLFDKYLSDVLWVSPGLLTMRYFQSLFQDLDESLMQNPDFARLYSKVYGAVAFFRAEHSDEIIKSNSEQKALEMLLFYLDNSEATQDLFGENNDKEEYLLIKTLVYKRFNQINGQEGIKNDKINKSLVYDFGLPLRFYVVRKSDRKLLKKIVKENELNVNLNLLKYYIDELKTEEEFNEQAQTILFKYLDGILITPDSANLDQADDILEIYENLQDLYAKLENGSHRKTTLVSLGLRYVYFKYHLNYVHKLEELRNGTAIVNASRMDSLRKVLDIVFKHIQDSDQVRALSIFKAIEMGDDSFAETYLDLQAFWKDNAELVVKYIKQFTDKMENSTANELWALVKFDFRQFLDQDSHTSSFTALNNVLDNGLTDFREIGSFRRKYFIEMIRLISLSKSFRFYREKKDEKMEYIRVYVYGLLFRAFGTRPEAAKYHLALEYDYFMSSEITAIKELKRAEQMFVSHQKEFYDLVKINNLRNLVNFPSLLSKVRFNFIFFKKVAAVLRFFDLSVSHNAEFLAILSNLFGPHPHFYHFNNIMLLLNLQKEIDETEPEVQENDQNDNSIMERLSSRFAEANAFDQDRISSIHERSVVLASKIAVVYFYTIYLQTCDDYSCKRETRGENWPILETFLEQVLTTENSRTRVYFFTDYLYENMDTGLFTDGYENIEYEQEAFIKAAESNHDLYPVYVAKRRQLVSWAYEHLAKLEYTNSPARFLENTAYDFYKELIRNKNFQKAEELTPLMIRNVLPFHRRNGHKVLNDWLRTLLTKIQNSPKLPEHRHVDLVLYNCLSEFVVYMNSPDRKYHDFQPGPVRAKLNLFVFNFFKQKGRLNNQSLHMPVVDRHLDIARYNMTHLVSIFSLLDLDLKSSLKQDIMAKHTNTAEFLAWQLFAPESYKSVLNQYPSLADDLNLKTDNLKKMIKTHQLNNYTNQNLEGYFQPLCHFEDAMISARFIEHDVYLARLERTIPECLQLVRKAGPANARKILFKMVKVFYMPDKYFQERPVIFEDDALPDNLVRVKKLFVSVILTAKEAVPFFEFAQMMQKVLSAQAKVVNTHFQSFFTKLVDVFEIDEFLEYLDLDTQPDRLLDVPTATFQAAKIADKDSNQSEPEQYAQKLKKFYINSTLYDVLTLIPIDKATFKKDENWMWSLDLFHLLNQKSNYASYMTNLFQNFNAISGAAYSHFYFLLCKFKLTQMLQTKAQTGTLKRDSNVEDSPDFRTTPRSQDEITLVEAPKLDSFLKQHIDLANNSPDTDLSILPNEQLIQQLYYLKISNIDINIVDMNVFEHAQDYAINLVQDIRSLLDSSDKLPINPEILSLKANLGDDQGLSNNLAFYYQEASKLNDLVSRYGDIDDKFEHSPDTDAKSNYKDYITKYMSLCESQFGLKVDSEMTMMYHRNLSTLLFRFETSVVF